MTSHALECFVSGIEARVHEGRARGGVSISQVPSATSQDPLDVGSPWSSCLSCSPVCLPRHKRSGNRADDWLLQTQVKCLSYDVTFWVEGRGSLMKISATGVCTSNASRLFVAPKLQYFQQNPFKWP